MKHFLISVGLGLLGALLFSCSDKGTSNTNPSTTDTVFTLSSNSFTANAPLPAKHTCDGKAFGEGVAPELHWTAGPTGTKSYAIVFTDSSIIKGTNPDPDKNHGYHWMIWNIPASITSLPEALAGDTISTVMGGAHQLSGGPAGGGAYLGPCPAWTHYCSADNPIVTDNYTFTIYAFDVAALTLPAKDTTGGISNSVRQMDAFFASKAIGNAKLIATSGAVPTSIPFPCPEFTLSSNSFTANAPLPAKHTCDGKAFGEGVAPELHWSSQPAGTKSYAIVFTDSSIIKGTNPDPDKNHGYHWMIWNIPASITSLPEALAGDTISTVMGGAHQLSGGPAGGGAYLGPCPAWTHYCSADNPIVTDNYTFTIYAFDVAALTLPAKDTTGGISNSVRQMDAFFASKAIGNAKLIATSGAVPTSIPFPCPEFTLSSNSFTANAPLPAKHTCDGKAFGEGVAPELHWSNQPAGTKSYAIVFTDSSIIKGTNPDPDKNHGYHWMIWNIPASIATLPEALAGDTISTVMGGAHQLSGGPAGGGAYLGPCPAWTHFCSDTNPIVTDNYTFTIYAFDVASLTLPAKDTTGGITNSVRQMDAYFASKAIGNAKLIATSGAVPTSIPFPCP